MWNPTEAAPGAADATEFLGDVRELASQIASPPDLAVAPVPPSWAAITSVAALRQLALQYAADTIATQEWSVIVRACQLTREGKARELIALDREFGKRARTTSFAEASFRVGRRQLNKLRGLRHERLIARYLAAIEAGEAWGWHPVVFGVVLGVYHLPLRAGLRQFAAHSLAGLITAAERGGRLPASECQEVLELVLTTLPSQIPGLPTAEQWASV